MTIRELMAFWEQRAPLALSEEWDNPGLLVGDPDAEVTGVLTTLDITLQAVQQAARTGANLIISHHPVIFSPLRRLTADSVPYQLAQHGIAALCLHTNLDKAAGGVNDTLIAALGWPAATMAADGLCRVVTLPAPLAPQDFAEAIARRLNTAVRVYTGGRSVCTVGVCSGAGGDCLLPLSEQVDAVLTGEIKHHEWLAFAAAGITAVEAGHYATEIVAADALRYAMGEAFPALRVDAFAQLAPYRTIEGLQ